VARPNELPPDYVPRAPEPRPEPPPRVEPPPAPPPVIATPPPAPQPEPSPEPVRNPGTAGPAPAPAVAAAPPVAPEPTPLPRVQPATEERSPWWAGARLVTIGTVVALVAMLALNFTLRRTAPIGAGVDHPMPETAIAQLPVVTADEDPLVTVPTGAEARALVHEFLVAYEARDAARLAALFAADGFENDNQGTAAIRSDYERTFADLADVTIDVPHIDSQLNGERMTITGPIVVAFRERGGEPKECAAPRKWEIARKNGTPRSSASGTTFRAPEWSRRPRLKGRGRGA
jgi:hypothetical protein